MKPDLDDYLAGLGISKGEAVPRPAQPGPPEGERLWPSEDPEPAPDRLPGEAEAAVRADTVPATVRPETVRPEDAPELLRAFVQGLADRAFPGLTVRLGPEDDRVRLHFVGEDAARAAGKGGTLLHATETLCYSLLARHGLRDLRVQLDAGDYRERQQGRLFALAGRIAAEVAGSGEPHRMRPMNPADRRLMHLALQDHPQVYTESEGEGRQRHLVVYPRRD